MNETLTAPPVERQLDPDNPWPGLQAFEENARDYFHGRDAEAEDLVQRVIGTPLTVLFGKSGLGKTSLLKAGLFPRLRAKHFLPVYVRLDIRRDAPPLAEQLRDALRTTCESERVDAPGFTDGETLWEYLHRSGLELWNAENYQLTPVVVVDQFEEQFTLGERVPKAVDRFRIDFGDLIENRIPTAVAALLEAKAAEVERLDLRAMPYKIIVSLREDFLPHLEAWRREIPSLGRVRVRLLPMRPEQALSAVYDTAPHLMDKATAQQVVEFVAAAQITGADPGASDITSSGEIEPALLSLFCRGLNEQRKRQGKPNFDAELLVGAGQSIITDYYGSCVESLPDAARRFIETDLITEKGFRNSYAKEDAVPGWLTQDQLNLLIQRRLLRVEERYGAERIELTHDLLTRAVREHRDRRRAAEHAHEREEEARQQQERERAEWEGRRQRTRTQFVTSAAMLCTAFALIAMYMWLDARAAAKRATDDRDRAQIAEDIADGLKRKAETTADEEKGLRTVAESAQAKAIAAASEADKQAGLALVGKVAAQSVLFADPRVNVRLDTAALLAIAGYRLQPSVEARRGLLVSTSRLVQVRKILASPTASNGVAFSPDGKTLVSAGDNGMLIQWDVETGRQLRKLEGGHDARAWPVTFSLDGAMIVSGDDSGGVVFWNAASGKLLSGPEKYHEEWVNRIVFSPDGTTLVSASDDETLVFWNPATRKPDGPPLRTGESGVNAVAFSYDGKLLATAHGDGALFLWNRSDREKVDYDLEKIATGGAFAVAFSPKGEQMVSGHSDGTVAFWDRDQDGKFRAAAMAREHQDWVYDLAFSHDGTKLVSASKDGTIVVWDPESHKRVGEVLRAHKNEVRSVMFSRDGRSFVSASLDNSLILWDVDATGFGHRVDAHPEALRSLAFRPDGKTIVSGGADGTLKIWDVATRKPLPTDASDGKQDEVLSVAFSPDGKRIASGRKSGALKLSDGATLTVLGESPVAHEGGTLTVAFSPDGKTLVSGGEDHKLRSWNPGTLQPRPGDPASGHDGPVRTLAFSPDGTSVASAGDDLIVRFWAAPGLKRIGETPRRHDRRVNSVAFDSPGRILASASDDGTVVLWDVDTRRALGEPLRAHRQTSFTNGVTSLSFSWDGRMLASGAGDKTVILWDVEARLPLDPLLGHTQEVLAVAFSPDGRTLVSGDDFGDLFFWDVDPRSWLRKLCAKLSRNLSQSEWDTYVGKNVPYQEQCPGLPKSST